MKQRRTIAKLEAVFLQKGALESSFDSVATLYPLIAKSLGLAGGLRPTEMDENKAQLVSTVALRHLTRGSCGGARQSQARSLSLAVRAALNVQES